MRGHWHDYGFLCSGVVAHSWSNKAQKEHYHVEYNIALVTNFLVVWVRDIPLEEGSYMNDAIY